MQKALFLDRDGVINLVVKRFSESNKKVIDGSPFNILELKFNDGILELVGEAKKKGYITIIATNQPSILKGEFSMEDYEIITSKICEYLGIERAQIFECFHKDGLSLSCLCRKPKPGLIFMAKGLFDLDLHSSLLLGDSSTDILAGKTACVGKTIYLRRKASISQLGNHEDELKMINEKINPDYFVSDLKEVINLNIL